MAAPSTTTRTRGRPIASVIAALGTLVLTPLGAGARQIAGEIELEVRAFPEGPQWAGQNRNSASFRFQPEWYRDWDGGRMRLTVEPFVRVDLSDNRRTHVDMRELSWERAWDAVELRVGIRRVFWGVAESQHLVDVLNQTDLVENPDGEDKLGQPMVNVAWVRPWGTIDVFVLPWFRERTFPGVGGRLRIGIPVATEATVYESGAGRRHVDWAIRWSHYLGDWDLGVSHFSGTSREPRLEPGIATDGSPALIPHYDVVDQTGIDVQRTAGSWLWKFEGVTRSGRGRRSYALTGGFEHTLYGLLGTAADLGLIAEYLWDSRGDAATTPFQDDVALGARLALNDTPGTELLAVAVADRRGSGSFVSVEGSRRLGDAWTLGIEARGFLGLRSSGPLSSLERDGYLGLTVTRYF